MSFLEELWDWTPGYGELRFIKDGVIRQEWYPLLGDSSEYSDRAYEDVIHLNEQMGYDAYFGVIPRISMEGKSANTFSSTRFLWADIDNKSVENPLAALNALLAPSPSIIVQSGGGLHAYWRLAKAVPYEQARPVMKAIAGLTGGDNVQDSARVLRVPGSINWKYDPPQRARIIVMTPTTVDFRNFETLVPAEDRPPRVLHSVRPLKEMPEWLMELVREGAPQGQRSEAAFRACLWLIRYGHAYETVEDIFMSYPTGIGEKMAEMAPEAGIRWLQRTYTAAEREA